MDKQKDLIERNAAPAGGIQNCYCRDDRRTSHMKEESYFTDSASQRQRILQWLLTATLTTLQARKELDVMHPAMRILELRDQGHNIVTHWETVDTGKAKHRVASYVLLADTSLSLGGGHD